MRIEEICLIILFAMLTYFGITYKVYFLEDKENKTKQSLWIFLEPGILFILKNIKKKHCLCFGNEQYEKWKKIYVGKEREKISTAYYVKLGSYISLTIMLCLLLAVGSGFIAKKKELFQDYFLKRESETGESKRISLDAIAEKKQQQLDIVISPKKYNKQQIKEEFQRAEKYIKKNYLGENESSDKITTSLNIIKSVPRSAIQVEWIFGNTDIIAEDGTLKNDQIQQPQCIKLLVKLSYEKEEKEFALLMTVIPKKHSKEELFWEEWKKEFQKKEEKTSQETYLELPKQITGKVIYYKEKETSLLKIIFGIMFIILISLPFIMESRLKDKLKKRDRELIYAYPEFIEQFVLLVGAGLNVKGTWLRILEEYQKKQKEGFLYKEMLVTVHEMENGLNEARAYELFGKRIGLLPYMKFCTLIVQNLKKGSQDLLLLLQYEVEDAFRARKENAKSLGAEAETKLLFPMMLMLLIVFCLILYAGFQSI